MSLAATLPARPFVPSVPAPHRSRLGLLRYLWTLNRNPIETWTERHFEEWITVDDFALGRVTLLNEPRFIRHFFVDNAANYEKDPLQLRILAPGLGAGLLTAKGEAWRRARRTLAPLFTPRRVDAFAAPMREIAEARVERWTRRRPGAPLEVDREMTGLTFDILSATLFSNAIAADAGDFEKAMTRYLESIGRVDPLDALGAPDWLPRFGRLTARPALAFFTKLVDRLVGERRALIARGETAPVDILTALLQASDPETGVGLTPQEVSANIVTFIAAGHETTARALGWTLYLLARAPAIRAEVEREAAAAPADPATWDEALPLTRAVIEEAMRLFPPAPLLSRMALEADRFGEVEVPARSLVVVAPWVLHRHRRLWKEPNAFRPERFLPGARETIDRFAYLPFGAGPRVCIGQRFAMMEAVIIVASIARRVRLSIAADAPEPLPQQRITLRPKGGITLACAAL